MNKTYEIGAKVKYRVYDKKGVEKWLDGVVHAVRRTEDPKTNMIVSETYVIDTGADFRTDEYPYDPRNREIDRQLDAAVKRGTPFPKALDNILKKNDLPESELMVEVVRQPEQIEVTRDHIAPA